jgi:hypothetical protein
MNSLSLWERVRERASVSARQLRPLCPNPSPNREKGRST